MYQIQPLCEPGTQLTTSTTILYTCPLGTNTRVTAFTAVNNSVSNQTYNIYLVPSGDSPVTANKILNTSTIFADGKTDNETYRILGHVLSPGDTIQGDASANTAISLFISGIETPA